MAAPFDATSGQLGFDPRSVGAAVWVDSTRVFAIDGHSYTGAPPVETQRVPGIPDDWQALGPFAEPDEAVDSTQRAAVSDSWNAFATDARGALVVAKLGEFESGSRRLFYLRTRVERADRSILEFPSAAPLAVWIDGKEALLDGPGVGRFDFRRVGWFDFREGPQASVPLEPGPHELLVRVETDYSGVGFFYVSGRRNTDDPPISSAASEDHQPRNDGLISFVNTTATRKNRGRTRAETPG